MNKIKENEMKVRLSTLWIFVLFNYVYADVLTIFDALFNNPAAAPIEISQGFLFAAAVLMENLDRHDRPLPDFEVPREPACKHDHGHNKNPCGDRVYVGRNPGTLLHFF